MIFTIQKMLNMTYLNDNKKETSVNGYAFIDECGRCIIIVYGESNRDEMTLYLSNDNSKNINI